MGRRTALNTDLGKQDATTRADSNETGAAKMKTNKTQIQITAEYGRKLNITEAQISEWLDDLPEQIDEIMTQPLRVGNDSYAGLSQFAFCAPEMIRGSVILHILKTNLASVEEKP